jgi:hypothetical protein
MTDTLCTLVLGSVAHTLPNLQAVEVECKYIRESGEAMGGPYGTTFRPSYYLITVKGFEQYNTDNPILTKLYNSFMAVSELSMEPGVNGEGGVNFITLSIGGEEYFRYFVSPYGMDMSLGVEENSRHYNITLIGNDTVISRNKWLVIPGRPQIPITSGRRQI